MWQELVWNAEFARGLIFFALAILAAIFLIPSILRRLQAERDKRLAKALLKKWGGDCTGAMMRLRPPIFQSIEIEGYSSTGDETVFQFWWDIKEGKRGPDGSAKIIDNALTKAIFSDEERTGKESLPDETYPFFRGDPAISKAMIGRILNPMYAKLEIFDLELLPINELEMAMSQLDTFSQLGHMTTLGFSSYAYELARSMEKFAKYLWKLENWSHEAETEEELGDTKTTAKSHFGIALALCTLALISKGLPQIVVGSTGTLFLIASIILFFNNKGTRVIIRTLLSLNVGYLSIFLGLVASTIVSFQNNLVMLGWFLFIGAYGFLIYNIVKAFHRKGTHR